MSCTLGHANRQAAGGPASGTLPEPKYFLAASAYCCEAKDGAVILDLRGDTYLGVDAKHLHGLQHRIENWPRSDQNREIEENEAAAETDRLIEDLCARGILCTSPSVRQLLPTACAPKALVVPLRVSGRRISLRHLAQFAFALLWVLLRLKRGGLASLLDWLCRHQSKVRRDPASVRSKTVELLASFLWLRAWCYTAQGRCLFDSLVLSVFLTREKIPCSFVIGVTTKPFLAHAWVQSDQFALNETAERIQDFEPILSTGGT